MVLDLGFVPRVRKHLGVSLPEGPYCFVVKYVLGVVFSSLMPYISSWSWCKGSYPRHPAAPTEKVLEALKPP